MHAKAPYLSAPFVEANFDFYSKYLRGVKRNAAALEALRALRGSAIWARRSARCSCEKTFGPDTKARALAMTKEIEAAMESEICSSLPWMGEATKKQALDKLHAMVNKIGYPGQVARLQLRQDRARRFLRQRGARHRVSNRKRAAGQDRQARGPHASGR